MSGGLGHKQWGSEKRRPEGHIREEGNAITEARGKKRPTSGKEWGCQPQLLQVSGAHALPLEAASGLDLKLSQAAEGTPRRGQGPKGGREPSLAALVTCVLIK